ncbi:MAG: hypothetical protein Q9167_003384 [Letrouitia subvulpina]
MALTEPDAESTSKSILLLDQVPGSFADQVDEACSILKIDIDESKSHETSEEQRLLATDVGLTPREEYTLKWLLKRFQKDTESPSPCLEPKAWILFRRLVVRLPIFNIARRLKAEGFAKILLKTFQQLKKRLDNADTPPNGQHGEDSTAAGPQKSRKRKRDEPHVDLQQRLANKTLDASLLCRSIILAVKELQSLTVELPDRSRGYAIEHMKSALRALPEHSASIFGTFISIVTQIRSRSSSTPVSDDTLDIEECLPPMIAIWGLRSVTHIGPSNDLDFSRNCLVPILQLLASLQNHPGVQANSQSVIDSLNRLLEKHIYAAAKIAFDFSKQRSPSERNEPSNPSVGELLAPLRDTVSHDSSQRPKLPRNSGEQLSPVALIFSILLKQTPRRTPKQRTSQLPWLQYIFNQLIGCSDILTILQDSPSISGERATTLTQMLQEAVKQKVRLEVSELNRVLSFVVKASLRKGNSRIGWTLTSLCLQVNPSVLSAGYSKAQIEHKEDNPLSSLLSDLNLQWKVSTEEDYVYDIATFEVLLPLARAFGEARDLKGFIHHWKFSLLECQSKRPPPPEPYSVPSQSIWESENLLQCVANLLESRLTIGQIDTILREIDGDLGISEDSRPLELEHIISTNLVLLDCILDGCRSEDHISELSDHVKSIIMKLLALTVSACSSESKWRFWRVLATFNWRWNGLTGVINPSILQHNVDDAIQLSSLDTVSGYSHTEGLFAVDFMLSFFRLILPAEKDQTLPSVAQHILSALEALLNRRIDSSYRGKQIQGSHGHQSSNNPCLPKWDFCSSSVASMEIFLLGCFALILTNNLLCSLPADMQRQYFVQVFRWALWSKKQKQEPPTESITFPYIWQQLQRSITLAGDARLAAHQAEGIHCLFSFYSELEGLKESQSQKTRGLTFSTLVTTCWGILYQSGLAQKLGKEKDSGLLHIIKLDEFGSWIEETLDATSSSCDLSIYDFRPTFRIDLNNIRDFADIVGKMPSTENIYCRLSGIAQQLSFSLDSKESKVIQANSSKDELLALVLEAMVRMRLPQDHNQLLELYKPAGNSSPTLREDIRLHLSHTFTHLCNCLFQPLPFQPALLSMQTLSLMLQKLARSTTQWHIDNTMAVITSAVAKPNPHTSPAQKGNIYLSACRLFSTILTLHRKRLGGRFHLVLLALQALLRCLFIPHTAFPPPDPVQTPHLYSAPHAAALGKLLSQLCSPAPSAVAKRRKDDRHLNDPVKKEREKVGRYMHIWLQTYCKCLLEGYLENEGVRKEVERGVGTVIDYVPAEGLRVLNAGMDAEGRGVWRGVWAEWKRRNPRVKE